MSDSEDSDVTVDSIELHRDRSTNAKNERVKHHHNEHVSRGASKKSPMSLKNFHPISDSEDEEDRCGDKDLFPSSDDDESGNKAVQKEQHLPKCQFWDKCYRKNPEHRKMFMHPPEGACYFHIFIM